jgi:hypothetical protein
VINFNEEEDEDEEMLDKMDAPVSYGTCIVCQEELNDSKAFGVLGLLQPSKLIRKHLDSHNLYLNETLSSPLSLDWGGKVHRPVSAFYEPTVLRLQNSQDYYDYMSSGLLRAVQLLEPYLHSPVDDLESFCYTMQWAGVNNDGSDSGGHETDHLDTLRAKLSDSVDNRFQATLFVHRIRPENQEDI